VGLVARIVSALTTGLFLSTSMTVQGSAWYSWIGYVALTIIGALTLYGFRTSIGGRPILATVGLDD
jgi:hypothetical protein